LLAVFLSKVSMFGRRFPLFTSVTNPAASSRFNTFASIGSFVSTATRQPLPKRDPANLACFALKIVRRLMSQPLYR
jgi:hypothetical protein